MNGGARAIRIFDAILTTGGVLSGVILVGVMLTVTVKVFFRYVLREGLIGIDQISGTMLLWITFLGAAWVLRREEHITIDLLFTQLGPQTQRWLGVVNSVICAFVCLVTTVYGLTEVITSWQRDIRIPAEIEIPRYLNLMVIPLGTFFLWLQFMRRALLYFQGKEVKRASVDGDA
ncbi:MAG: TRAP transporter small permease subunit [Rhodospirillales bacterium]|jgi:TRAP-type C4-dicarboxylate transport system permease small subunit|nr:TRAP transporter small permease subunit [Rhodospirillales bacterium]HJO71776.1 TRAP transporter small permease subunit [Rhodospirillales bacterium]